MAEGERLGVAGQPVGGLDAGDLGAAVEVVEVVPLLAHGGQAQGEAGGQVAGLIQGRAVSRLPVASSNISRSSKPAAPATGREFRAAGGAEAVTVVVALAAEHEAHGAGNLGGARACEV